MLDTSEHMVATALDARAVDFVVTAYRGNPEVLVTLLSSVSVRDNALHIVVRAGDEGLANALGSETIAATDPIKSLSRREREVYDLVCEGLSNAEIAQSLFISEATVKVHVHHVFDKVGVRSRTALAMNAARDRWRYAAFSVNPDSGDAAGESPASATIPASSE